MPRLSLPIVLLLAFIGSTVLAQDCSNPLLPIYDLPGLDDPQSGSGLPYCANLQNVETCCSADTVATFQDRANGLIDTLNNFAAARDLYVAQLRNSFFDRFTDFLEDIDSDHQDDLQEIRRRNTTVADQLQTEIDSSKKLADDARNINSQFLKALDDYQTARSNCFTTALQTQTSSWCLACDPNYATQGVDGDGNVVFSDELCQAISDACTPFFDQGSSFNPLIRAREAYWRLAAVDRYLSDFSDNQVVTDFVVSEDPYNPLPSQQEIIVPNATGYTGACQNLWARNPHLRNLLTIGATVPTVEDSNSRLLQDSLAGDEGVWNPDLTATGLDFGDLRLDPGDFWSASDYSDYPNRNKTQVQVQVQVSKVTGNRGTDSSDISDNRPSDTTDSDSD